MALSFTQQIEVATNDEYIRRVQQAMVKAAIAVSGEAASGDDAYDSGRLSYATIVLRNPQKYASLMIYGVVTDASITASITDNDLYGIVTSMWNAYSGVRPTAPAAPAPPAQTAKRTTRKAPAKKES